MSVRARLRVGVRSEARASVRARVSVGVRSEARAIFESLDAVEGEGEGE